MKRLAWKIPGMIAVTLRLWSFVLIIASLIVSIGYEYTGDGFGQPFRLWVSSILVAMLSMLFSGGIPMVIFVGGDPRVFPSILWNVYYLAMAVLEVLSVVIFWREGITVDRGPKFEYAQKPDSCMKDEVPITRHSL